MHYFARSTCLPKLQKSILHVRIKQLTKKVTQAQDKENKKNGGPYPFVSHINLCHTHIHELGLECPF